MYSQLIFSGACEEQHVLFCACYFGTVRSSQCSTGFCFFYWRWWEDKQEYDEEDFDNRNDYGGFKANQLFIKAPKYKDLKQEIVSNTLNEVTVAEYETGLKTNPCTAQGRPHGRDKEGEGNKG